jgi:hypothetical protein
MTEPADEGLFEYYMDEVTKAADESPVYLYTPSVLREAAQTLQDIQAALDEHGIGEAFTRPLGSLAGRVLNALCERFAGDNYYVSDDIDPVALLNTAVQFVPDHLGRSLVPQEGPMMADARGTVAYVVLPRGPETPPWGEDGEAPLVVVLGRTDLEAYDLIYSSGGGPVGDYQPGPWAWCLSHRVPDHYFIGQGTQVVAQAPSNETAGEVAGLIAQVLTGEVELPR